MKMLRRHDVSVILIVKHESNRMATETVRHKRALGRMLYTITILFNEQFHTFVEILQGIF